MTELEPPLSVSAMLRVLRLDGTEGNPQKKQKELNNILVKFKTKIDKLQKDCDSSLTHPVPPVVRRLTQVTEEITKNKEEMGQLADAMTKCLRCPSVRTQCVWVGRQKHIESPEPHRK